MYPKSQAYKFYDPEHLKTVELVKFLCGIKSVLHYEHLVGSSGSLHVIQFRLHFAQYVFEGCNTIILKYI